MLRITSFKILTQFLRKIADAYCQADYAKLYQELQLRYEQQIFSAFLNGTPVGALCKEKLLTPCCCIITGASLGIGQKTRDR